MELRIEMNKITFEIKIFWNNFKLGVLNFVNERAGRIGTKYDVGKGRHQAKERDGKKAGMAKQWLAKETSKD